MEHDPGRARALAWPSAMTLRSSGRRPESEEEKEVTGKCMAKLSHLPALENFKGGIEDDPGKVLSEGGLYEAVKVQMH